MKKRIFTTLKPTIFLILTLFFSVFITNFLFKYDNKYTMPIQPSQGILVIKDSMLLNEVTSLVDDWEFYPDEYLYSSDFREEPLPEHRYVFIGQYPDYSLRDKARSPFGHATYRLTLKNEGKPRILSFMIPSLYSSSKVYLNGECVVQNGQLDSFSYQAEIKRNVLTFNLNQETEIILQVANYHHYYSGLYAPPLLGSPEAIHARNFKNITFYSFLIFTTLSIFVYCCFLWMKNRSLKVQLYLGLFCLSFAIYVLNPLLLWIGIKQVTLFYAVSDTSFMCSLACVLALISTMTMEDHATIYKKFMKPLSIFMIFLVFFFPFLIFIRYPKFVDLYGSIIDLYKYLCAFYSLYLIYHYHYKNHDKNHYLMVYLVIAYFSMSLLSTLTSSNQFEPVAFGWLNEYSSFLLVLLFMAYMVQINIKIYVDNLRLTEHLKEEVEERTLELTSLLNDRKVFLADIAHDLKAPLSAISTYLEYVQSGNVHIDDEVKTYLEIINHKSCEATSRVVSLQKFTEAERNIEVREMFSLNLFLKQIYESFEADMEASGIYFKYISCKEDCMMVGYPKHLNRAIGNLLYNAMSFTPVEGHITIQLDCGNDYTIRIRDDGSGIDEAHISKIFDRYYSTRLDGDNSGLGLHITKEIIAEHNGKIHVTSQIDKGTTFIIQFKR